MVVDVGAHELFGGTPFLVFIFVIRIGVQHLVVLLQSFIIW